MVLSRLNLRSGFYFGAGDGLHARPTICMFTREFFKIQNNFTAVVTSRVSDDEYA